MAKGNVFNSILVKKPEYSWFDLSHDNKLSLEMGKLVPILAIPTIPGDKFQISAQAMFRMQPMLAPIMHKIKAYVHYFFVPNRLIWPNWEKFMSPPLADSITPVAPVLTHTDHYVTSSLGDYLGVPTDVNLPLAVPQGISALPFAAYQFICDEFFRDENLQPIPVDSGIPLVDGPQSPDAEAFLTRMRYRAWEHDYFTSALPWAQKGDDVLMPIDFSDDALEVLLKDDYPIDKQILRDPDTGDPILNGTLGTNTAGEMISAPDFADLDPNGTMYIDPTDLQGTTTINDLRNAIAVQRWLEKNAVGGTRYIETLLVHFGVKSSDQRLQRPEYIGGNASVISISEVLQTSATDPDTDITPQGNMAGHGIGIQGAKPMSKYCEEHGFIIGILSVRPTTAYYQGLPRHFVMTDRTHYPWPDFVHLGEEGIHNRELCLTEDAERNEDIFGYIPRYSSYRYLPSGVHGDFRTSLDFWHLGRKFDTAAPPVLNGQFVTCRPDNRIFAVEQDTDHLLSHVFHNISVRRCLTKFGTPGIL